MDANNRFVLENLLIRSYAHFKSFKLNASFKSIVDLVFEGLPEVYSNFSMTRISDSQYLMHTFNNDAGYDDTYRIDIATLKAERLEVDMCGIIACFVEGEYMLVVVRFEPIIILRYMQDIGEIEFIDKDKCCKNVYFISGRYIQQVRKTVYAMDHHGSLYRIEWQDIKGGKYRKTLIRSDVNIFYADRD